MALLPFQGVDKVAAGTVFVRVAVERGVDRDEGLTYRFEGDKAAIAVGERVEVPVGRGDQRVGGVVLEVGGADMLGDFEPARVKAVLRATGARIPASLVELGRWLAGYYCCPVGMVLASMLPAAVKAGTGSRTLRLVTRVEGVEPAEKMTKSVAAAWDALRAMDAAAFPMDPRVLAAELGASNAGPVNKLIALGVLAWVEQRTVRAPELFEHMETGATRAVELTPAQASVVEGIAGTLGGFGVHLVHGVTGSGKTEVYLRVLERSLAAGKNAVVLVPEIALTPQTAGRFVARFREFGVAVLHSGLSASARHKQWQAAASGEARVVVGARSAVFAPVKDLGVIVVDEEHDSSYKQDQLPRYHARDVAIKRAHIEGCAVVLGSATPSLESWHNARSGRYGLWRLEERVGGGRMPRVTVVDMARERLAMRAERGKASESEAIGPTMGKALTKALDAGGQAILLLNRRGFASVVVSSDKTSGWKLECERCDATMVVHRGSVREQGGRRYVRCHHCGDERLIPAKCPMTGKPVIELGTGTQRVEEEIERRFGASHGLLRGQAGGFERVDADTMKRAADYFDVLGRFGRGELRVLLGTQMIAKGLDFPGVSLVGVLSADTALALPDFRAEERTFQLVAQVAGRAGRGERAGEVVVQTYNPENPAIVLAGRHDYAAFAEKELVNRTRAGLPPVTRMARVVVRDEDHEKAWARAAELVGFLREAGGDKVRVDGPQDCVIARIADKWRVGVEMVAGDPRVIQGVLGGLRARGLVKSDAATAVDVDPVAMM
jgi:primosomal protein N' (replication factor Y)